MKLLRTLLVALILVLVSCVGVEQEAVDYGVTKRPKAGDDKDAQTKEDEAFRFSYSIANTKDTINAHTVSLGLKISEKPKNGQVSDCILLDQYTIDCLYIPNKDYFGEDTIEFKSVDGDFDSKESAQMKIKITPVPDPPVAAEDQNYSTPENSIFEFNVKPAKDVDSIELNYSIVKSTTQGNLECFGNTSNNLKCVYTPNKDFYGIDKFTYSVVDELGLQAESYTDVIIKVNNYPEVGADQNFTMDQYTSLDFKVNQALDYDSSPDELQYKIINNPTNGTLSNCFVKSGILDCTYTPNNNYYGSDNFSYSVIDEFGKGLESLDVAIVNIKINKVDLPPMVGADQIFKVDQGKVFPFQVSQAIDQDTEAKFLKYVVVTPPTKGSLQNCFNKNGVDVGLRDCEYAAGAGYYGDDFFTYKVIDNTQKESAKVAKVIFKVNKVYMAPKPKNDAFETMQGKAKEMILSLAERDPESLDSDIDYFVVKMPVLGTLSSDCLVGKGNRKCVYTPTGKAWGDDFFEYKAVDTKRGLTSTITARVDIKILKRQPPTVGDKIEIAIEQYSNKIITLPEAIDLDTNLSDLTYTLITNPTLVTIDPKQCLIQKGDRNCKIQAGKELGTETIYYKVKDDWDLESDKAGIIEIKVIPRIAPVAKKDVFTLSEGQELAFNITPADSFYNEQHKLRYIITNQSLGGNYIKNCFLSIGNTSCVFVTEIGKTGKFNLEYKVVDQYGIQNDPNAMGIVEFNVIPKTPPVVNYAKTYKKSVNEATVNFEVGPGSDLDTPKELWPSTATFKVTQNPKYGTIVNCFKGVGNRLCSYYPKTDNANTDVLKYKITDKDGLESLDEGVITFEFEKINQPPRVGKDDSITVEINNPKSFVVQFGSDPDHYDTNSPAPLFYYLTSQPTKGSLSNCLNNTILNVRTCTYTPDAGIYDTTDSFTYEVRDPDGLTSGMNSVEAYKRATVYLKIIKVDNRPRVGDNQIFELYQGETIKFDVSPGKDADIGDLLTYFLSNPNIITANGNLKCFLNGAGQPDVELRNCEYTPKPGFVGDDYFTYKVKDTKNLESLTYATVTLRVKKRNPPRCGISNLIALTVKDKNKIFNVATATDNDTLVSELLYKVETNPLKGKLTNCFMQKGSTQCEYTPDTYGTDVMKYRVFDEYNNSSELCEIAFNIENVNTPPVAYDGVISTAKNTPVKFELKKALDKEDLSGNTLKYVVATKPRGILSADCFKDPNDPSFIADPENRTCTYTPQANDYGADSFTFYVVDGKGIGLKSNVATFTINIINQNTCPEVGPDQQFGLFANGKKDFIVNVGQDAPNETTVEKLRYKVSEAPKNGKLYSKTDPSKDCFLNAVTDYTNNFDIRNCTYEPDPGYYGQDKFTYTVYDEQGMQSCNTGTVSFVIDKSNNKPIVYDIEVAGKENEVLEFEVPIAVDSDSVKANMLYRIEDQTLNGTLECFKDANGVPEQGNRRCKYTPRANYNGVDIGYYNVTDDTGLSSERKGKITINISGIVYSGSETITQGSVKVEKADIVWVVDNSGSMKNDQDLLRANFASFIDNFVDANGKTFFPFKMAITTTEAYIGGNPKIIPSASNPYDLSSTLAETNFTKFKSNFTSGVALGTSGSGTEKSLESLEKFYGAAVSNMNYGSDGFFGPSQAKDSLAIYVIISDEREQSAKSISSYISQFQGYKPNPALVRFFPIVDTSHDTGNRYSDLARLSGGKMYSILNSFDGILNDISNIVKNLIDSLPLRGDRNIFEASVKVYFVDPVTNVATPVLSGWKYQTNTIKFDNPPPADTIIRVDYDYTNKY